MQSQEKVVLSVLWKKNTTLLSLFLIHVPTHNEECMKGKFISSDRRWDWMENENFLLCLWNMRYCFSIFWVKLLAAHTNLHTYVRRDSPTHLWLRGIFCYMDRMVVLSRTVLIIITSRVKSEYLINLTFNSDWLIGEELSIRHNIHIKSISITVNIIIFRIFVEIQNSVHQLGKWKL